MKPIYSKFEEHVNPDKIVVTLLDGRKLEIKKIHVVGGKRAYQLILRAFDDNMYTFCNRLLESMIRNLQNISK